jgi:hypothetical protein
MGRQGMTAQATPEVTVRNDAESGSYVAILDGEVVGTIVYESEEHGSRIVFRHTIVEPDHRGQGIGSTLVRAALDDVRAGGLRLTNYCGFVAEFLVAHPEYADLVDPAHPGHPLHR